MPPTKLTIRTPPVLFALQIRNEQILHLFSHFRILPFWSGIESISNCCSEIVWKETIDLWWLKSTHTRLHTKNTILVSPRELLVMMNYTDKFHIYYTWIESSRKATANTNRCFHLEHWAFFTASNYWISSQLTEATTTSCSVHSYYIL